MTLKKAKRRSNPVARALSHPVCRPKIVASKKGKASYKRRPKHVKITSGGVFYGVFCFLCFTRNQKVTYIT